MRDRENDSKAPVVDPVDRYMSRKAAAEWRDPTLRSSPMKTFLTLTVSLSVVLLLPQAAEAGRAAQDLALERTEVIVEHDYRRLPRVGPDGEMGFNRLGTSTFSVAHQQHGDLYIRAGIVRDDPSLIKQGFKAFDYAFTHQRSDGSFPDAEQAEEYAFFLGAVAHSIFLLRETAYAERYDRRLRRYVRKLRAAVPRVIEAQAWADFSYRNRFYTHSAYVMGSALTLTGLLTRQKETRRYGKRAIRMGLERQLEDGINPELGNYDVRYQMVGLTYAERFAVYFRRSKLAARVANMIDRGLSWMEPRIDDDGWINWYGSTRACREISPTSGKPKSPGYAFSIRGFAYWGVFRGRPALVNEAESAHRYAARAEDLCGPKEEEAAVAGAQAGTPEDGAEALRSRLARDRYE